MTTNRDRAAKIIRRAMTSPSFRAPESRMLDATDELADAGLLTPDLPPVTADDLGRPSVTAGPASPGDVRDSRTGRVLLEEDGLIFTTGVPNPYRSIDQARAHALAILAMCDHAEGDHDD